jgi:hypothetical protein
MKFAPLRSGAGNGRERILLRPMLHNFCRIHAAKRSFRGRNGRRSIRYCKLIQ